LLLSLDRIAAEVAKPSAESVDQEARFPTETLAALREAGALGAAVPRAFGGQGASLFELARMCATIGQGCAASGMVLAMHHIQVLCLARHNKGNDEIQAYLERIAREQRLIASVTSEVGPSGDMRQSVCAVKPEGGQVAIEKHATVLSYGSQADDLLITARRTESSAPSDQVLVLSLRGQHQLSNIGKWDTLGMRGTCSPGATVKCVVEPWQVLATSFGEIATHTMVPVSHVLWGGVWLGIAADALSKAQQSVRKKARSKPGEPLPSAHMLAQTSAKFQVMRNEVHALAAEHDRLFNDGDEARLSSLNFALKINNLKLSASRLVFEVAHESLYICGVEGYKNGAPLSCGRNVRDSMSAALMVHNDRLLAANANLVTVQKGT
jgi:acyl-CoA dehydrogenase